MSCDTSEPVKVTKGGMDVGGEMNALSIMVAKGFLEVAEEAMGTRDAEEHATEFAQQFLPFGQGDPFLGGRDRVQYFHEACDSMRG